MSIDTTPDVRWFELREAATEASEAAGDFPNVDPTATENGALRAGLATASLQIGSQRAEIEQLRTDLAIAEDKAKQAGVRAGNEYVRGLRGALPLFRAAAAGAPADVAATLARSLAAQVEAEIVRVTGTRTPDSAPALPEVPTVGAEAGRG